VGEGRTDGGHFGGKVCSWRLIVWEMIRSLAMLRPCAVPGWVEVVSKGFWDGFG
jgi:hypothetical protein